MGSMENSGVVMNITCVIPARGGSKGVPKKNIKELTGIPLICHSINVAKQVFSDVYVSTENSEISDLAKENGAKIIKRPYELASDTATDYDWLKHAFSVIKEDNIAILRPTTPMRCAQILHAGINLFEKNECSSMRSAHEAPESPYKWFEIDREGIYWKHNLLADMPRQALPKVYVPNGYLDITRRETVERGTAYGDKILSFITDYTTEIDTKESFEYLEYLMSR